MYFLAFSNKIFDLCKIVKYKYYLVGETVSINPLYLTSPWPVSQPKARLCWEFSIGINDFQ